MTAVPPRPAAPNCTCGHDGLPANFHMTPCPIKVAHLARLAQERTAPDAAAGDGLRELIARAICESDIEVWRGDASSFCEEYRINADAVLALPALRDVLAAAARDADTVARVRELADYWGGSYSSTWLAPSMALTRVLDGKTP